MCEWDQPLLFSCAAPSAPPGVWFSSEPFPAAGRRCDLSLQLDWSTRPGQDRGQVRGTLPRTCPKILQRVKMTLLRMRQRDTWGVWSNVRGQVREGLLGLTRPRVLSGHHTCQSGISLTEQPAGLTSQEDDYLGHRDGQRVSLTQRQTETGRKWESDGLTLVDNLLEGLSLHTVSELQLLWDVSLPRTLHPPLRHDHLNNDQLNWSIECYCRKTLLIGRS